MMTTKMKTKLMGMKKMVLEWKSLVHRKLETFSTRMIRTIKLDLIPTWLVTWVIWPKPQRSHID